MWDDSIPGDPQDSANTSQDTDEGESAISSLWSFAASAVTSLKKKSSEIVAIAKKDFAEFGESLAAETNELLAEPKAPAADGTSENATGDAKSGKVADKTAGASQTATSTETKATESVATTAGQTHMEVHQPVIEKKAAGPGADRATTSTSASAQPRSTQAQAQSQSQGEPAAPREESASWTVSELGESVSDGLEKLGGKVEKLGDQLWGFLPSVFGMSGPDGQPLTNTEQEAVAPTVSRAVLPDRSFKARLDAMQASRMSYVIDPEGPNGDFERYQNEMDSRYHEFAESQQLINLLTHPHVRKFYDELVPEIVEEKVFWTRYLYRAQQLQQEEDRRQQLLSKLSAPVKDVKLDDADLSWDDTPSAGTTASTSASAEDKSSTGQANATSTTESKQQQQQQQSTPTRQQQQGSTQAAATPQKTALSQNSSNITGSLSGSDGAAGTPRALSPTAANLLKVKAVPKLEDDILSEGSSSGSDTEARASKNQHRGWVDVGSKERLLSVQAPAQPQAQTQPQTQAVKPVTTAVASTPSKPAATVVNSTPVKPASVSTTPAKATASATKPASTAAASAKKPSSGKKETDDDEGWDVWE